MSSPNSPTALRPEWHILLRGQRLGPYTQAALHALLETLPDGWSTPVWRPGMLDWRAAQQVDALAEDAKLSAVDSRADLRPAPHAAPAESVPAAQPSHAQVVAATSVETAPYEHAAPREWAQSAPAVTRTIKAEARFSETPSEAVLSIRAAPPRSRPAPHLAETTRDLPAYRPARTTRRPLPIVASTLAGLLVLAAALFFLKPTIASIAKRIFAPRAVEVQAVATSKPEGERERERERDPIAQPPQEPPPTPAASTAQLPEPPPPTQTTSESARRERKLTSVRIRAHWAPIRSAPDPHADVLCSLQRGTWLPAFEQRPGRHARWFRVHCDAQTFGWVHENFLGRVRLEVPARSRR